MIIKFSFSVLDRQVFVTCPFIIIPPGNYCNVWKEKEKELSYLMQNVILRIKKAERREERNMDDKLEQLKGHLIVSCQALPHEPLHSSFIMGRMARAAAEGGALGIRANTKEDIEEIKKNVDLPVIGIVKRD